MAHIEVTSGQTYARALLVTGLLGALSARALARGHLPDDDDEALPCRPTIACTADLVPPGDLELEVGALYRRLSTHTPQLTTPFLLKLSVATWAQLQVASNGYTYSPAPLSTRFFDDVQLGVKLHLVDGHDYFPSLSWSIAVSIPTSSQEGYVRTYDALLIAYISEKLGPVDADLNVGMNLLRLEGFVAVQPWVALAISVDLPHKLTPMIEFYDYADARPVATRDAGMLVALGYTPRKLVVVDAGFDVGFFQQLRSVSAFVGLTIIAGNLWVPKKR